MPQKISPFVETKWGWNFGESGWNTGMDENLLKFSFLFNKNIDGIVSVLPAPVNGEAYYLTTDNRVYFAIEGTWYSSPIPTWFELALKSTGQLYKFNGTGLVNIPEIGVINETVEELQEDFESLGSAAFLDASDLATQQELDAVSSQSTSYTDGLRTSLETAGENSGAALIPVLQNTASTVVRTIQDKFQDYLTLRDFGAVGDGFADDLVALQNAFSSGKVIFGVSGDTYKVSKTLSLNSETKFYLNESEIICSSGFTDKNLININSSNVHIYGPGVVDGTGLPSTSAGYDGTDFTGITIISSGESPSDNKTGVVLSDFTMKSGQAGALLLRYCPNAVAKNLLADGSANILERASNALIAFNYCSNMQANTLRAENAKWKAIEFRNSSNFVTTNLFGQTSAVDQCALFFVGATKFVASSLVTVGGFGIKADSCEDGVIEAINVDCSNIGQGGVYIQGCSKTVVRSGLIRNFTSFGVAVGPHTTKLRPSIDCEVSDILIHRESTTKGDLSSAVYLIGDSTYGLYGTTVRGITSRTVDIGIRSFETTTILTDNIRVQNCRFKDIKSYLWYGPATSMTFEGNKADACAEISDCIYVWSKSIGTTLIIDNNEFSGLNASANVLNIQADGTRPTSYNQVSLNNNKLTSGLRLVTIAAQNTSSRIRNLNIQNNMSYGASSPTAISLSSASGTNMQVNITGNSFYSSDGITKQAITFAQDATTLKFNGIVVNNMANVTNTPSNT